MYDTHNILSTINRFIYYLVRFMDNEERLYVDFDDLASLFEKTTKHNISLK